MGIGVESPVFWRNEVQVLTTRGQEDTFLCAGMFCFDLGDRLTCVHVCVHSLCCARKIFAHAGML